MKDLIDLGNQVFNVLKERHNEIEESRMLFLYFLTEKKTWSIINSTKTILIEKDGITKNFSDSKIDALNLEWLSLKQQVDYTFLTNKIARLRAEFDRPAPKDGDVWEFGGSGGTFKNMKF